VRQDFVNTSNTRIETMKRKKKPRRDGQDAADAGETQRMTAA